MAVAIPMDKYYDSKNVISVQAVTDELKDGYVVKADALVDGEIDIYNAEQITAITEDSLAMVVGYEYYEDDNSNRINITDPTKIVYVAGKPVLAYRLLKNARFVLSTDAYTGTAVVGEYLNPTASSYLLTASATPGVDVKYMLQVEKLGYKTYRGLNAIDGIVVRVVIGD